MGETDHRPEPHGPPFWHDQPLGGSGTKRLTAPLRCAPHGANYGDEGHVPEWLWSGLQNRLPRFNSGRGLHNEINDLGRYLKLIFKLIFARGTSWEPVCAGLPATVYVPALGGAVHSEGQPMS